MQVALTYTRTRKSIHVKANIKIKRLQMSKEKMTAWRSMLNKDVEDAQTMREMHAMRTPDPVMDNADMEGTGLRWRNAPVPEEQPLPPSFRSEHEKKWATPPEETAMHALWNSERRINLNGQWYVPLTEVADILTAPTEDPDPLSEEWQAQTFPNLNIGNVDVSGMVESEPNDMRLGGRIREAYWKDRNRIPDRY